MTENSFCAPDASCALCPRLVEFLQKNRRLYPDFHNAPVASFGDLSARILVVGLAPGLKGANRTGRPFTGDYAGDMLYPALIRRGLATGVYQSRADDGVVLKDVRITNSVRCVPPENRPLPEESKACLNFLKQEVNAMPNLKAIFALGQAAHQAVLNVFNLKKKDFPFKHAFAHEFSVDGRAYCLVDTFHTSRRNVNTGKLTPEMFENALDVLQNALSR